MSSLVHPSGRLPARVYWLRRVLLLVLVVGSAWMLARCAGDDRSTAGPQSGSTDAAQGALDTSGGGSATVADTGATAGIGASVSATAGPPVLPGEVRGLSGVERVQTTLAVPAAPCDPAETAVTPSAEEPATSGSSSLLQLRVGTTGQEPCRLLLGSRLLVQVSGDDEAVWSLADCPSALPSDEVVLHPGWGTVVALTWSGRVSNASCSTGTADVRPGTYQLQAAVLQGEPGAVDLEVLARKDLAAGRARGAS